MKKLILLTAALCFATVSLAQFPYAEQRKSLFAQLPIKANDIVFFGNSITNGCEWAELFNNRHIKNRGINGDRAVWMVDRLDSILNGHPKKLFLLAGINDLAGGISPEEVARSIEKILDRFVMESPWTKIYVQSIFPVNKMGTQHETNNYLRQGPRIIETNKLIEALCEGRKNVWYIDVHSALVDEEGQLDKQYTNDGVHLLGEGYLVWKSVIEKLVK